MLNREEALSACEELRLACAFVTYLSHAVRRPRFLVAGARNKLYRQLCWAAA